MKLSSQEEYGLRCLLQLARHEDQGSLTIPGLARLEGISVPHVGKIMRLLRRGQLVRSTRGQSGGYTLERPAAEISVGEVLAVLGGRLFDAQFCDRHSGVARCCAHLPDCSIRPVLRHVQQAVDVALARLTLRSLVCNERDVLLLRPKGVALPLVPMS